MREEEPIVSSVVSSSPHGPDVGVDVCLGLEVGVAVGLESSGVKVYTISHLATVPSPLFASTVRLTLNVWSGTLFNLQ